MRIAIVNWSRRKLGGAEAYIDSIIPGLTSSGHEVALFHEVDEPTSRDEIFLPPDAPGWCVNKAGAENALAGLREWSPDVIYAHGLLDPDIEARTLQVAPAVFFGHSFYGMCISGSKSWSNSRVRPCHKVFGPACLVHYFPHRCGGLNPLTMFKEYNRQQTRLDLLRKYKYVIAGSEYMRSEYASHGLNSLHVPLFADDFTPSSDPLLSLSQWKLLFIGRMDHLKGGLTFIESLPHILTALNRPLHVTFAGDGPDRELWQQRAGSLQKNYQELSFEFPGWISGEARNSLLATSDLLVVPSQWPEPFGLNGPEVGLRGVPAAAFDVGGISDWLKDGINGYLAPSDPPTPEGLAEAVIKCLSDPTVYFKLRKGAIEVARSFTKKAHLEKLVNILEEVSAGRGKI